MLILSGLEDLMIIFVFLIFAITCFIFSFLLSHSQKSFEKNCQYGTAMIIGYRVEDNSSYDTPIISFIYEGREVVTGAQAIRSRYRTKIGERVPIAFVKDSFSGHETWRVRIISNGKTGKCGNIAAKVMFVLGILFLGVTASLLILCYV